MKKIVFATNNLHKLKEIREIVGDRFEIVGLGDIGCNEEIPETGTTLAENALQKAHYVYDKYGYDCFADDTGLMVDALDGAPGVYSARYAALEYGKDHCTPQENVELMLEKLNGVTCRSAHFSTVIALIMDGEEHLFEGMVEGEITTEKAGCEGFGYDPIFKPEGWQITFAEASPEQKNAISHRGHATQKLLSYLNKI